ncbi:MAG: AraC family transcriptional regulator [Myxococcales bacterium]|nr:AraC family transcriptional regulator [Myxococcales bacterium]
MATGASINSRMLWPWILAFRDLGLDPKQELARVGLTEGQLRDPGERIPYDKTQALIAGLVACSGRRDLGLLSARVVEAGHFELLELAARSARTLGAAIEHIVRFFSLVDSGGELSLEPGDLRSRMSYQAISGHPAHPAYIEYVPALLLLAARRETGRADLCPLRVSFRHAGPEGMPAYGELFGCQVRFNAPATVAVVDSDVLFWPMIRANSRTHRSAISAICDWFLQTGT